MLGRDPTGTAKEGTAWIGGGRWRLRRSGWRGSRAAAWPCPAWLAHTGGIVSGMEGSPSPTLEALALGQTTPGWPPGRRAHYSNVGYAVLGLVLERVAGCSYVEALRRHVLGPCAMTGWEPVTTAAAWLCSGRRRPGWRRPGPAGRRPRPSPATPATAPASERFPASWRHWSGPTPPGTRGPGAAGPPRRRRHRPGPGLAHRRRGSPDRPFRDAGFRLGDDAASPERAWFTTLVEGRPIQLVVSGWPFDRVD